MHRGWIILAVALSAGAAPAQTPLRFQWRAGQVLTCTARQTTTVTETTLEDGRPVVGLTVTRLILTRRWEVTGVDPAGVATLELSVTALRQRIARPGPPDKDGKPTVDASDLDSATAEGRRQMAAFLGKPIVTVRVDPQGRVVEATGSPAFADRLRAEPPFRITLPDRPAAGWNRAFTIKLDPPLGTGEEYAAVQKYTLRGGGNGRAVIGLSTALTPPPKDPAELPPLVPLLWEGEAYFDPVAGRYLGAKLTAKREVVNHQGEGTRFVYDSEYTEEVER